MYDIRGVVEEREGFGYQMRMSIEEKSEEETMR